MSAAAFDLANSAGGARLAVVGTFEPDAYTVDVAATASGIFDLGVVVPGATPGQLIQIRYSGVSARRRRARPSRAHAPDRQPSAARDRPHRRRPVRRRRPRSAAADCRSATERRGRAAAGVRVSRDGRRHSGSGNLRPARRRALRQARHGCVSRELKSNYAIEANSVDRRAPAVERAARLPVSRAADRRRSCRGRCRSRASSMPGDTSSRRRRRRSPWRSPTARASSDRCEPRTDGAFHRAS